MTQTNESKSIWYRLQNIPINVIQGLFLIAMIVPIIIPLKIPFGVTPPVQEFYDTITNLPEGSVVVYSMQLISFNYGDCAPSVASILNLLYNSPNKLKVLLIFPSSSAPMMFDIMLTEYEVKVPEWRTYGEDWARFDYYAGLEQGFSVLVDDWKKIYPTDYYDTPIEELPVMDGINTADSWDLLIEVTSYTKIVEYEVRQAYARYGVPCLFAPAGMTLQTVIPYYPHISSGYVMGIGGAGQLNALQGISGTLVDTMGNAFSLMSIVAFIFSLIGVVAGFIESRKEEG
jgi:hypothetical protein